MPGNCVPLPFSWIAEFRGGTAPSLRALPGIGGNEGAKNVLAGKKKKPYVDQAPAICCEAERGPIALGGIKQDSSNPQRTSCITIVDGELSRVYAIEPTLLDVACQRMVIMEGTEFYFRF
jgi:hypothetical protein